MIQGQLKALNPVRGWIPVVMDSAVAEKLLRKQNCQIQFQSYMIYTKMLKAQC